MKAFFHPAQDQHIPKTYFTRGQMRQPQELPDRTGQMLEGLKTLGVPVLQPADQGAGAISKVHDLGYLRFLESAHRRWQLRLEEADFDLQLGRIESEGPVALDAPRLLFRGRGLELVYNELRGHLEWLKVREGDELRITGDPTRPGPSSARGPAGLSEPGTPGPPAGEPDSDTAPAPVRYRARFTGNVRIESEQAQIEAETARALELIRAEVAELTLAATAKVTGKVLDRDDHRKLIEDAIGDLDFSALEPQAK
jgi:hypothetical protein